MELVEADVDGMDQHVQAMENYQNLLHEVKEHGPTQDLRDAAEMAIDDLEAAEDAIREAQDTLRPVTRENRA